MDEIEVREVLMKRVFLMLVIVFFTEVAGEIVEDKYLFIDFVNDRCGWIMGGNGIYILKTIDGGRIWNKVKIKKLRSVGGIRTFNLIDEKTAICVDHRSQIFRTTDRGMTWKRIGHFPGVWKLFFLDKRKGWGGTLLDGYIQTDNGGRSWREKRLIDNVYGMFQGVYFISEKKGWMAGLGVWITEDGGENWKRIDTGCGEDYLLDCAFISDKRGWAVGEKEKRGVLLKSEDGGLTWEEVRLDLRQKASHNSWAFTEIKFINDMVGWVNSDSSIAILTTDGGKEWREVNIDVGGEMDIYFKNDKEGWCIGRDGVYETHDGGASWARIRIE